ncbi:MAG: hypothetical protein MHPDNHAH_00219 [Anaerolineales bacterium]|nr:hypothetical protein [Anaerolineales bacterium]
MRFPLDALSFDQLLWLVPIFFTLHNLEEAPFMEAWTKRLPLKIFPVVSTRQFVIAVTFLTLGAFLVTFWSVNFLQGPSGYLIVLGIQAALFFNAFIPHLAATIRFHMYSPGAVTATLITIPFSLYLFQRALAEQLISWNQIWFLLAIAPFAIVFFAFISLQIGKALDKKE